MSSTLDAVFNLQIGYTLSDINFTNLYVNDDASKACALKTADEAAHLKRK